MSSDDVRELYRNFDQFHPWVKKLLVTVTYGSGGSKGEMNSAWMDHTIAVNLKAMPTVRGRLVGMLSREEVKQWDQCFEKINLDAYLDSDQYSESQKTDLRKDLWARKWAVSMLQRLEDDETDEQWRTDHPEPPLAPLEGDPASGENDEAGRGASLPPTGVQELTGLKEQLLGGRPPTEEEGREEVNPTAPRETLEDVEQPSQEVEPVNTESEALVSPAFIKTGEELFAWCKQARERIRQTTKNPIELHQISQFTTVLEELISFLKLGREGKVQARMLQYESLYWLGRMREPNPGGRGKRSEPPLTAYEIKLASLLSALSEEQFYKRLEKAEKEGALGIEIFKIKSSKGNKPQSRLRFPEDVRKNSESTSSTNGTNDATEEDMKRQREWEVEPLRRIVIDFLGNELWYLNQEGIKALGDDPQIRETLPGMKDKLKLCLDRVCEYIQANEGQTSERAGAPSN
jgi:hypothetical protein